jgi:hypothetical protein
MIELSMWGTFETFLKKQKGSLSKKVYIDGAIACVLTEDGLRCKTCKKPHTSGSQTYTVSPFFQPK